MAPRPYLLIAIPAAAAVLLFVAFGNYSDDGGPCGPGYHLAGDICVQSPPGFVDTRNDCERGVDSREAAGVPQDYQAELAKCRAEN